MFSATLPKLRCPRCKGSLSLNRGKSIALAEVEEISSGQLLCEGCDVGFPILGGVALLVPDAEDYILEHVKGISLEVADSEIPRDLLPQYLEAKSQIESEHIEEDLEAERVVALYVMNHYLTADSPRTESAWWRPLVGNPSPLIDSLIRAQWDQGPFAQIVDWTKKASNRPEVVELGCGVGGLARKLKSHSASYLGIDESFASIAVARHLALGIPRSRPIRIPEDLLEGPVSREVSVPGAAEPDGTQDFVIGDVSDPPLIPSFFDVSIALNAIDMLPEPESLPRSQRALLKDGGMAIQSCPFIWHPEIAAHLRSIIPNEIRGSARVVEWLYEKSGFKVLEKIDHFPWLFFKQVRQLEIYSAQLFSAQKT